MTIETRVSPAAGALPLDYYLLLDGPDGPAERAEAVVVEEFVRAPGWWTVGLGSALWTPAAGWRSSASFSQAMRAAPEVRARVRPVARDAADRTHRRLGGGPLPDERALRTHLHDRQVFPATAPLRLGDPQPPDGCHERRVYRVLFAGDLPADRMAGLAARWRPAGAPTGDGLPAGHGSFGDDRFSWTMRRIGGGVAWAVDLTVELARAADDTVGPVLHELTSTVRLAGLIPVTTERFS